MLEVLGGGGMGVVYRAEDLKLGRRGVEVPAGGVGQRPQALERFEREARAASRWTIPTSAPFTNSASMTASPSS